jgi:hypothetical protein
MENQSKQKYSIINDYIALFFVLGISMFFVYLMFIIFDSMAKYDEVVNWNYAYSLGGILAFCFQLIYLISGGWSRGINIFIERWTEFFGDMRISFKFAVSSLFENFISNGITFFLYLFLLMSTLNMCVHGCQYLISLYGL